LIKTSLPENRKSFGSLMAWLRPLMKILAVCMMNLLVFLIDTKVYISKNCMSRLIIIANLE
jgi:hypothetical protein